MKTSPAIHRAVAGHVVVIATVLGAVSFFGPEAKAQSAGYFASDDPYVTVDMSVLEAGNSAAAAKSFARGAPYTGTLVIPGPSAPVSILHIKPSGGATGIPASDKGRVALRAPVEGPAMPPDKPPVSAMDIPGKTLPEPSPEKTAAPEKPMETAAVAPPPPAKAAPRKPVTAAPPAAPTDIPPPPPAVAAPAPPPSPKTAKTEPAPAKIAAATPAAEPPPAPPAGAAALPGKATQIVFESSVSKLPENSKQVLKGLVDNVIDDANLRLQLLAYAGGESLSSSKARRLSLSRALSVRSFLIENGLRSTRIDVRALGNKTTQDPVNRVDINVVER